MNSLNASTEVMPNRQAHETIDERLRRLTKEALNSGHQNQFGPLQNHPATHGYPQMQIPGGVPHESGGPDSVIHRIAREVSVKTPRFG